jgi:hypothetical protein
MKTAIVCYYADLGRPYGPLIERMTGSARAVMPDAHLMLLTPTPDTPMRAHFHDVCPVPKQATFQNLCLQRAVAISSWAGQYPGPTIFVDPDLEFLQPVKIDSTYDVGLLWREKPDQPVNTGLIVSQNQRTAFWKHYGKIACNLPRAIHHWWADQLAFGLLTGVCHKPGDRLIIDDARVRLLAEDNCPPADKRHSPWTWAVHHKGRRKGPGWEHIFRSDEEAA